MEQTQPPQEVPCRLYVILAREAPVAVVFRRGPSKWVQAISWDTAKDTFTPGQWFHGRIYERRCDLSPDGKLLVYFAMNLRTRNLESDYSYAWTAVSRPPYLTALALWPKGSCWGGGGLFLSDHQLWLNHGVGMTAPHPNHLPRGLTVTHGGGGGGEDEPIYSARLERDGWRQSQAMKAEYTRTNAGFVTYAPGIRRKQNPLVWQKLTMTSTLSHFEMAEQFSVRYEEGQDWSLEGASWADWDQRGRLVYAQEGRLYTAEFGEAVTERELADFNGHRHEPMEAPEWAKKW